MKANFLNLELYVQIWNCNLRYGIRFLAYKTNHKQGATKLLKQPNKYLLTATFENGEYYLIWFEISNNGPMFNSIQSEKKTIHKTTRLNIDNSDM